jgi:hypothetical protein
MVILKKKPKIQYIKLFKKNNSQKIELKKKEDIIFINKELIDKYEIIQD